MGFCVMELSSIEDPVVRQALARNQEQKKEERGREEVNAMPRGDRTGPMGMGANDGSRGRLLCGIRRARLRQSDNRMHLVSRGVARLRRDP